MPAPVNPLLQMTKYASAWFEHGHPFNDAAYSLVQDAPMMAVKMSRFETVLREMEDALGQTRDQLMQLVELGKVDRAQLSHVEAALNQLQQSRRELETEPA